MCTCVRHCVLRWRRAILSSWCAKKRTIGLSIPSSPTQKQRANTSWRLANSMQCSSLLWATTSVKSFVELVLTRTFVLHDCLSRLILLPFLHRDHALTYLSSIFHVLGEWVYESTSAAHDHAFGPSRVPRRARRLHWEVRKRFIGPVLCRRK
jgi:hypothetical protein